VSELNAAYMSAAQGEQSLGALPWDFGVNYANHDYYGEAVTAALERAKHIRWEKQNERRRRARERGYRPSRGLA
jgi:hypothetical protein